MHSLLHSSLAHARIAHQYQAANRRHVTAPALEKHVYSTPVVREMPRPVEPETLDRDEW